MNHDKTTSEYGRTAKLRRMSKRRRKISLRRNILQGIQRILENFSGDRLQQKYDDIFIPVREHPIATSNIPENT
jgi:activator of HSP90 ATPase